LNDFTSSLLRLTQINSRKFGLFGQGVEKD